MLKDILLCILKDPNVSKLEDSTWESVFAEFESQPDVLKTVLEDCKLFNVALRYVMKCKDSGFYTAKGYFSQSGDAECVRSIEEAECFSPVLVDVKEPTCTIAWYIANCLIDEYGWFSPDGGYNCYKNKSYFDKYSADE